MDLRSFFLRSLLVVSAVATESTELFEEST
jgi:hypothetical protein